MVAKGMHLVFSQFSIQNLLLSIGATLFLISCNMQDFCSTVKKAGGIPVLAHPGYLYERNPDNFIDFFRMQKSVGLKDLNVIIRQILKLFLTYVLISAKRMI